MQIAPHKQCCHILMFPSGWLRTRIQPKHLEPYHLLSDTAWCELWLQRQICNLIKKEGKTNPSPNTEQQKKSPHRGWPCRPQLNDYFHL